MKIVKYHNDINNIKIGTLNERELNLFVSILFKVQEKENNITIKFNELLELEESKNRSHKRLVNSILKMNEKLITLNRTIKTQRGYLTFNLFNDFAIFEDTKELKISINENFKFMLNGLIKDFTYYSLKEYVNLKSGYSKQAYKLLRQFRKNCWYQIELKELKEKLLAQNYDTNNFNKRVLAPILKELSPIFKNLKIIKLDKNGKLVGRGKKTISLRFEWEKKSKQPRKSLRENIKAKEDKERAEANKKAKARIERTDELISKKRKKENDLGADKDFFNELKEMALKVLEKKKNDFKKDDYKNNYIVIKGLITSSSSFESLTNLITKYKLED